MNRIMFPALATLSLVLACSPCWAVTCQHGIPPSNPDEVYVDHGDGTVTDSRTGLMWKRCGEGQSWSSGTCSGTASIHTWSAALALAEAASFAGHGDWRLPNFRELRGLVEECRAQPAINDSVFPNTSTTKFWSGSPDANYSGASWGVDFDVGVPSNGSRSASGRVRLVRAGQ